MDFTIIFFDELGRVAGFDQSCNDHDYECWEYAREKMAAIPGATSFGIWHDQKFICAEGDGAIEAVERLTRGGSAFGCYDLTGASPDPTSPLPSPSPGAAAISS